jgi:GR25 family glycosyltransferase involved in LPS biosynthesis
MDLFTPYIIVYSKDQSRYENYLKVKNTISNLKYYEAVDTITDENWNKWKTESIKQDLTNNDYIRSIGNHRGKLGCNLSHQLLLKQFVESGSTDWLLVMEDDITLTNYTQEKINSIVKVANSNNSKFIQLYTHPGFNQTQYSDKFLVDNDTQLYKMIPQWGTVAYLIHVEAISNIIHSFPVATNMDYQYNRNIGNFNSLCLKERIFFTAGTIDGDTPNSEIGESYLEP